MCDNDFVECDLPKRSIDIAVTAWVDFRANPSDQDKFQAFDLALRVAAAKWESYSTGRRVAAACDVDVDAPVNLLD